MNHILFLSTTDRSARISLEIPLIASFIVTSAATGVL